MKKNRFTEFFKGKGYYMLLFVGVLAIAAVALIGSQVSSSPKDEGQNQLDLNDTDNNIAAKDNNTQMAENNPVSDGVVNNNSGNSATGAATKDNGQNVASNDNVELEGYDEGNGNNTETAKAEGNSETAKATGEEAPAAVETAGTGVQTDKSASLTFNKDKELLWPVNGNVIMNYSMDHTIYFATLMQYKCNPAIIIGAKVGTQVKAAAKGVVSKIDMDNEETGYTVTMNIGNGFSLVYGQLKNVKLKVGDAVNEGNVIGTVNEPTKYYTVEGSNLYFEVLENDVAVNPMLYLH